MLGRVVLRWYLCVISHAAGCCCPCARRRVPWLSYTFLVYNCLLCSTHLFLLVRVFVQTRAKVVLFADCTCSLVVACRTHRCALRCDRTWLQLLPLGIEQSALITVARNVIACSRWLCELREYLHCFNCSWFLLVRVLSTRVQELCCPCSTCASSCHRTCYTRRCAVR